MDCYEVIYNEREHMFVVNKNDYIYAKFPERRDVEHFLTLLVKSTMFMPAVDITDDVFNEDWTCLFFRIELEEEEIRLVPCEDYYIRFLPPLYKSSGFRPELLQYINLKRHK